MLPAALITLAIAAVLGLGLAPAILGNKLPAMPHSLLHGAAAAIGLVLAILALLSGQGSALAVIILVVAALGGFFLFSFHLKDKPGPKPVVVIHALAAVAGFALLALSAL